MRPREIIYHVVKKYLDEKTIELIRNDLGKMNYGDIKFIKLLEKHFDFSILIKNPIDPQDPWIYNYLYYETRKKDNQNPLQIGDRINFQGSLPKKGLVQKYLNEVILGKTPKKLFK